MKLCPFKKRTTYHTKLEFFDNSGEQEDPYLPHYSEIHYEEEEFLSCDGHNCMLFNAVKESCRMEDRF